jgi:hypothetical protein
VLLRIATEIREVREGSAIKMMTMLEVVLASIRAAAANGSHPAQRLIDRLLSEPPEDEPMIPKGVLIIPEKLTHEEWSERYGQG